MDTDDRILAGFRALHGEGLSPDCLQYWQFRCECVEYENAALTAHLARMAAYKDRLLKKGLMPMQLAEMIEAVPINSLERLINEKQAEVLELASQRVVSPFDSRLLVGMAKALRG